MWHKVGEVKFSPSAPGSSNLWNFTPNWLLSLVKITNDRVTKKDERRRTTIKGSRKCQASITPEKSVQSVVPQEYELDVGDSWGVHLFELSNHTSDNLTYISFFRFELTSNRMSLLPLPYLLGIKYYWYLKIGQHDFEPTYDGKSRKTNFSLIPVWELSFR